MYAVLTLRAQAARERLLRWKSAERRPSAETLLGLIEVVPLVDQDAFVDELLGLPTTPDDSPLPRGAVPYLPCGVDEILKAIRHVPIREDDTFIDLGSGIGRVAILVNLLTGARAHGLEIQPHLVELAREHAAKLHLDRVSFECRDVRELPADRMHADGAGRFVLFLFAPFNGEMLASALETIHAFAIGRNVVVCTVAMELPDLPWLERVPTPSKTVSIFLHVDK